MKLKSLRPADQYGLQRVIKPADVLPQQADKLDPSLPIAEDEILIEVECLNIDSASFKQISVACGGDLAKITHHIEELVTSRGKQHNRVTGSGGMLIGRVAEVGPQFPVKEKPVSVGDRVATLVSLSLTPLEIRKIKQILPEIDRVEMEGHAILFASGIFAVLPQDIPDKVALAVLDVAGAPAQTRKIVQPGQTVVVVGGGGKSGLLCLYEAKQKKGVTTIAVEYSREAVARLEKLSFVDHAVQADATKGIEVMNKISKLTRGKLADVVINVANVPETEMACILSCKNKGLVYFFSMATSFTRAALGAEGVGADVELMIGNGYTEGHAEVALNLIRQSSELREIFETTYA